MTRLKSLLGATLAFALLSDCRVGQHYTFQGYVYDGVTRQRVTSYTIEIQYGTSKSKGTVDSTGKYTLEGLMDGQDYTVVITADGYRAFESQNKKIVPGSGTSDPYFQTVTFYADALLYPNTAQAPAYSFQVRTSDSDALPSGKVQFIPQAAVGTFDKAVNGANIAVWINTLDFYSGSVGISFTNGDVQVAQGQLKAGVTYTVRVSDVAGYELLELTDFVPGETSIATTVFLKRLDNENTLKITFVNNPDGTVTASGDLVITFNQPVEFPDDILVEQMRRAIETSTNTKGMRADIVPPVTTNGSVDTPRADSEPFNSRGLKAPVLDASGTKLTLSWSGDAIFYQELNNTKETCGVTYGGLDSISVRPKTSASGAKRASQSLTSVPKQGGGTIGTTEKVITKATTTQCSTSP